MNFYSYIINLRKLGGYHGTADYDIINKKAVSEQFPRFPVHKKCNISIETYINRQKSTMLQMIRASIKDVFIFLLF